MKAEVVRYFSENHNPVDILIINGDNRAIVTKIAKFDDLGKMSHCEWILADHRSFKEFHSILVKSTDENAIELFSAINQINENWKH